MVAGFEVSISGRFWVSAEDSTPQPPPSVTAGRATGTGAGPYHGNVRSKVYHAPGCSNYDCKNCTAVFAMMAEAEKAGYRADAACVRR